MISYGKQHRAFTLIEILIALFIFVILSIIISQGLQTVVNAYHALKSKEDQLEALQLSTTLWQEDLTQIVNRPVRDALGAFIPPLKADVKGHYSIEFTATGHFNTAPDNYGNKLQRIGYALEEGQWIRLKWNVLDRALQSKPQQRVLLRDIRSITMHFFNQRKRWVPTWPDPNSPGEHLPSAVEIVWSFNDGNAFSRIIRIPAGTAL